MEKFTEGEWQTEYRKGKDGMYSQDVFCSKGGNICSCSWYGVDQGGGVTSTNREDNAHLIAAAPDMYRILKSIDFDDGMIANALGDEFIDKVIELLKKARGE